MADDDDDGVRLPPEPTAAEAEALAQWSPPGPTPAPWTRPADPTAVSVCWAHAGPDPDGALAAALAHRADLVVLAGVDHFEDRCLPVMQIHGAYEGVWLPTWWRDRRPYTDGVAVFWRPHRLELRCEATRRWREGCGALALGFAPSLWVLAVDAENGDDVAAALALRRDPVDAPALLIGTAPSAGTAPPTGWVDGGDGVEGCVLWGWGGTWAPPSSAPPPVERRWCVGAFEKAKPRG